MGASGEGKGEGKGEVRWAARLDKGSGSGETGKNMSRILFGSMYRLVNNPVFLSALFSWFLAQFIKTMIDLFRRKSLTGKELAGTLMWRTGGMPSSHSALVTSLATSIGYLEGPDSSLFILSLFYAVLTVRDALGVRRSAGNLAQVLNQLGEELTARGDIRFKPVKEVHGHTTAEVSVGILLGFFIALAFCSL